MANVFIEESTLTAIGNAIRGKTGSTELILPSDMPAAIENIEIGSGEYSEGFEAARKQFWDGLQDYGNRTNYERAFLRWSAEGIKPYYSMHPTNCSYMFYNASKNNDNTFDMAARFENLGIVLDTSQATTLDWMFYSNDKITRIPVINTTSATNLNSVFYGTKAHTIDKVILKEDGSQTFSNTFAYCANLKEIRIEGKIGNNFQIGNNSVLSVESMLSIFDALLNYKDSGTTHTCSLGSKNLAKLTNEQKAIATEKGWTLT